MHYYKRNIGDYAKKAGRLSMLQHGAYTLLIDSCYDREQFPTLDEAIDWTWSSSQAEIDAVKFVLSKFFVLQDGVYVHPSIKEEIDAYHETSEKNKRIAEEREAKRRASSTDRARVVHEESKDGHLTINQEPLTINQEPEGEKPRKRDSRPVVAKPDDVDQQTWDDWQALRKAKRAPVTETVVNGARKESEKAGMSLDAFLQVWCRRGSQGLEAEWLKPDERLTVGRTFAQQAADIARTTVPSKPGRDPALLRIEEDAKKAAPIPENIREKLAALKGGVLQ